MNININGIIGMVLVRVRLFCVAIGILGEDRVVAKKTKIDKQVSMSDW